MLRTHVLAVALLVVANLAMRELAGHHPAPPAPTPAPTRLLPITDPGEGPSCNADFLHEIRRHPRWTLRIDANEERDCGLSPLVRDAYLVITQDGAYWQRDRRERYDNAPWIGDPMPQRLELTAAERTRALRALDNLCTDTQQPSGFWNFAVAIDPTDDPVMFARSAALETLLLELHDRYVAKRVPYVHELSAHLHYRTVDERDRIAVQRIDIVQNTLRSTEGAAVDDTDDEALVDVLDCLASLPEGEDPVLWGTLVVRGHPIWIAAPRAAVERATCLRTALHWNPTDRTVAAPSRYPPPSDAYVASGYSGFEDVVGLSDGSR